MKKLSIITGVALLSGILAGPAAVTAVAQSSASDSTERVLNNYLAAQSALARDSLKNVSTSAEAMVAATRGEGAKAGDIARQAAALAKARSLTKAREAFKPLSQSLIGYLETNGVPAGTYYELYCPTVKAEWVQTGKEARNPYLGLRASTATWGWACAAVVRAKFESPSAAAGRTDLDRKTTADTIN